MTEQGYPPRQPDQSDRSGRSRTSREPGRTGWQMLDAFDAGAEPESDLPPWAVPGGIEPLRPARRPPRRPVPEPVAEPTPAEEPARDRPGVRRRLAGRTRAAAARRRRSRRRLVYWGGAAIAVVVIIGLVIVLNQPPVVRSQFVTTLQKGELSSVPDACHVVGAATLGEYLPGTRKSIQPFNYRGESECTYTVDARPVFRVLNVTMQAYQPAGYIPVGNGNATANAAYTYGRQRRQFIKPAKNTPQPPATITPLAGLGQEAFSALQVFHVGTITDWVTVVARYHNVLVTASLEAQASGGFGPVSIGELRAGALAVARQMMTAVQAIPPVS